MNERIKKLVKQAGLTFVNSITDDNEDIECVAGTNGGLPCSTELEKFAELIVRECADICYNRDYTNGSAYGEAIEEHFGVEE